jgi:hypothetical protein
MGCGTATVGLTARIVISSSAEPSRTSSAEPSRTCLPTAVRLARDQVAEMLGVRDGLLK